MVDFPERVQVDFLILSDKAEVINGKLYMMGGGWDQKFVSDIARPVDINIVVGLLVPWSLTNESHDFSIRIEHEDGTAIQTEVKGSVKLGRPINSTNGQVFRVMASIAGMWQLPQLGAYRVVVSLAKGVEKKTVFYVLPAPARTQPILR